MTDRDKNNQAQPKKIHAFCDDVLADLDGVGIARLLRNKEVSPKEVITATIQRAQKINPVLNAITSDSFTQDLTQPALQTDSLFAGVPCFIKDNIEVKDFPTAFGVNLRQPVVAKKDNIVTTQFKQQGFVVVGKSALPEFGFNASTEFQHSDPTRNPWHLEYSSGASSGGAAALVAAGVVPIAHANDGGGSIRIPAACCGLVGLKPSRGRLQDPLATRLLPINLVSNGIVTRSVRDTAHFYAGLEKYYQPKHLAPIGLVEHAPRRRLRIGLIIDSISTDSDEETRQAVYQTAKLLQSLGHEVEEFKLPFNPQFIEDFSLYWGFLAAFASSLGPYTLQKNRDKVQFDNLTLGLAGLYKRNLKKSVSAFQRLKQIQAQYQRIFSRFDVFISPVLAHTTPKLGYLSPTLGFDELFDRLQRYVTFTPIHNIAGAPSISLPLATTRQEGLPIGVLLSANIGDEKTLLELAFELEQAQGWKKIHA